MSTRAHGARKAAALRKVRRITGVATGGAALSAAVFGGLMSHEIPGTSSASAVTAKVSTSTSTSTSTKSTATTGSVASKASGATTTTSAPTTTTTTPTVVSGATSS